MPFTESKPLGLLTMLGPPPEGGTGAIGAVPPPEPLTQTPSNRVGFVPHGQVLAAAGDETTSGAAAMATAQPKTITLRFTVTIYAP
jgi:hypothetical protein